MSEEKNLKPSIIGSYHKMHYELINVGLTERDIIILLQSRTIPQQPRAVIKAVLLAIEELDKDIEGKLL